jgi:hypothetical protein
MVENYIIVLAGLIGLLSILVVAELLAKIFKWE